MILSDHHFAIGHQHSVCEDYAASREGFAALADGCSTVLDAEGKPIQAHTDIGARLLVRAAFRNCDERDPSMLVQFAVHTADEYRRSLELSVDTLSATLLGLRDDGDVLTAFVSGDGLVAARSCGKWQCFAHQYHPRPFYPRYCLLPRSDGQSCDRGLDLTVDDVFQDSANFGYVGGAVGGGDFDPCQVSVYHFPKSDCDFVLAMSDGAFSFLKDGVPYWGPALASQLLDFRRMKGRFVLRNLSGVLRELAAKGIVHQDDISMIALYEDGDPA